MYRARDGTATDGRQLPSRASNDYKFRTARPPATSSKKDWDESRYRRARARAIIAMAWRFFRRYGCRAHRGALWNGALDCHRIAPGGRTLYIDYWWSDFGNF